MAKDEIIEEGKGNQGTFGRSLMKYVQSRLPYQSYETLDTLADVNPKYRLFQIFQKHIFKLPHSEFIFPIRDPQLQNN